MSNTAGFTGIATADLQRLLVELAHIPAGTRLTKALLSAARMSHLWESVCPLGTLEAPVLSALISAILAERAVRHQTHVDLVWTGGEAKTAYARPTATVLRELFESAEQHVLVAGYSFDHGRTIFEPLHSAMLKRSISVEIYLHISRAHVHQSLDEHVHHEVTTFFAANWPFGNPYPVIYIAPRTIDPHLQESLHAKCCVVDERVALIGSANFTDRGQTRNIEAGARIEDTGFAQALVAQFNSATNAGVFRRYTGRRNCT